MNQETFQSLANAGYNRIPITMELFADLDTPLSVYLKLANAPYTYLLESVVGGERFSRYSFIGLPASTRIRIIDNHVQVEHSDRVIETFDGNPLDFIENFQQRFHAPRIDGLPRFTGGLSGYFGYDTVRYIETRLAKNKKPASIGTPDILLMQTEELAVFDNLTDKLYLICYADPSVPNALKKAQRRLETLRRRLRESITLPLSFPEIRTEARSDTGQTVYENIVKKSKEYIFNGDIMQVVPAQRMSMPFKSSPLALYRALRGLNPSPYMYLYHFDDFHVVGSSPEILVRRESDTVTVRPLAGTRARGKTPEEDQRLAEELLADPKEIAEHVMLIDLGRNDIGIISDIGSVKVTEKMIIERYSHVMHIVSSVEGKVQDSVSNISVLKATFPAGTLSGASKVRAMEIIDELEPHKREVYAGAVGYLSFNGDMDLAIAIRTAVIKDEMLYVQAGAGIVADSDPHSEWMESQNKARAIIRAAEMVQKGLDS